MPNVARHVLVSGHVQGVGFRWFVRQAARAHSVAGWVRNLEDGRVEAWLEGEPDAVAALVERLRTGKPGSRVEDVAVEEREAAGFTRFELER